MCGIVGLLTAPLSNADGAAGVERSARRLRRMAEAVRHRGPDGEGFFSDLGAGAQVHLGHRRLSIIDPSPAGAQPMTDGSGRYTLVFNGAIYNYVELGAELRALGARFRGHSDTEVLCEAWAAWGPAALSRLNGMFAFAIWDKTERTLHLCRDRFGVKPLYYAWLGDSACGTRLLFASEAKALFVHPALAPRPDARLLSEFLLTRNIDHYEEATLLSAVLQVPPATWVVIAPGAAPLLRRYWALRPTPAAQQRPLGAELVAETRALLADATGVRLRSDVPLGGTLSGGLDSSLLTGLVAGPLLAAGRLKAPYRLFLSQFPGTSEDKKRDESPWAEKVLAALPEGAVLPQRSSPSAQQMSADLEDVLFHQEEPFADTSILAHFALMRVVRQSGVKVVLTGQGADEVFAGYPSYYYALLGDLLSRGRGAEAVLQARARARVYGEPAGRLLLGGAYHATPALLRDRLHHHRVGAQYPLSAAGWAMCAQGAARHEPPPAGAGVLDAYLLDCIRRWALPHILRQDDRNAMAFGVESRAPFLDYRLAELAFTARPEARLSRGYTKLLLREAGCGLMPEDVRLRPDKMGFWSPQRAFLRDNEALVRDVAGELAAPVAELTAGRSWPETLAGFYERGDNAMTDRLWSGFLCSLWIRRTLPRMQGAQVE